MHSRVYVLWWRKAHLVAAVIFEQHKVDSAVRERMIDG
jgi:hypothetical protein